MKTPVERISLRKRLALEVSRQVRENNKKLQRHNTHGNAACSMLRGIFMQQRR